MKKDWISGVVSVAIIAASSGAGIVSLNRADITDNSNYRVYEDFSDEAVSTEGSAVSEIYSGQEALTSPAVSKAVTSAVSAVTSTAVSASESVTVSVTETSEVTSTVSETEITEASEETEAAPPETEAPPPPQEEVRTDPPAPPEPEPETEREVSVPDSATEFQREVFRLVNERRAELGVRPLNCTEQFNHAADIRAEEIHRLFEHTRPDGREWYTIFSDTGIPAGYMGENIAGGSGTPQDVFNQWAESPDHYKNMINPDYSVFGIGYYRADDGYYHYWVQLFG